MNYCSDCGAPVTLLVPEGDNRERHVCDRCGTIHYQNPKMVVGCIPEWEGKVLLCRRAIQPRLGLWTLPAGFMERGETTRDGAVRETLEEANARVRVGPLYCLFNLPHIDQVYMLFRARLLDLDFHPGEESLEVRLFAEHEIPWDALAFQPIRETLRLFFRDRAAGIREMRSGDIVRDWSGEPSLHITIHEDPGSGEDQA
ncbi:NUDIX hydrolase [Imhoffiella purpurea]|uniref:FAD pyrophosphatase n=1 Tax=Imhoffiella purpurea TaxID=1249627 RepID=W9VAV0_9GAMM|nr:NUDIX hydrolase [Imhoffiella purpurea]EXJ14056.1 FAD pyrophosphatase [Imhoffiella purpurea]